MDSDKCCICLLANTTLTSVNAMDSNNVKLSSKIIFIVPEVGKIDDCLICELCIHKLEEFIHFKEMLLNSLNRLKLLYVKLPDYWPTNEANGESNECISIETTNIAISRNCNFEDVNNISFQNLNTCDETELKDDPIDHSQSPEHQNTYYSTSSVHIRPDHENQNIDECYKCDNCGNFYTNFKNLIAHRKYCLKSNNSEQITQTTGKDLCEKKATGHRARRTFVCEVCQEKYDKLKLITDHYITVHSYTEKNIKPCVCHRCDQKFSTLNYLYRHLKYHKKDRSKMCTTCGKLFITTNDLISHQYIHLNRRNYKCSSCDKAFNTNKNLRTHLLVVHTDRTLWKYHCQICNKRFPQKSNLDQHSKRHNNDKQHVCHICEKRFISSNELKRHIEIHSNIKLFRCIPCGTEFKTKRSHERHVNKKHNDNEKEITTMKREKKFVCHICPSQFCDKANLLRHLSRHSGLKAHACSLCEKKFSDKAYLKQHVKLIHKLSET